MQTNQNRNAAVDANLEKRTHVKELYRLGERSMRVLAPFMVKIAQKFRRPQSREIEFQGSTMGARGGSDAAPSGLGCGISNYGFSRLGLRLERAKREDLRNVKESGKRIDSAVRQMHGRRLQLNTARESLADIVLTKESIQLQEEMRKEEELEVLKNAAGGFLKALKARKTGSGDGGEENCGEENSEDCEEDFDLLWRYRIDNESILKQGRPREEDLPFFFDASQMLDDREMEVRKVARSAGIPLTDVDKIQHVFEKFDADGSGDIEKVEFKELMRVFD